MTHYLASKDGEFHMSVVYFPIFKSEEFLVNLEHTTRWRHYLVSQMVLFVCSIVWPDEQMVAWKPYTRSLLEIIVTSLSNLFYPGSQRIIDPIGDPLDTDGVLLFHPGHDQPWANFGKGGMHRPPPPMRTPKARSLEGGGDLGVLTRLFIYLFLCI